MNWYMKFKRWATWATVEEACEIKPLAKWRRLARLILPMCAMCATMCAPPALASNRHVVRQQVCNVCPPVVHAAPKVVAQVVTPQTVVQNQQVFYPVAPYVQQSPITDAAVQLAQCEQIKHNMQLLSEQVNSFQRQSSRAQAIVVYPQIQMQQQGNYEQQQTCDELPEGQSDTPRFNQTNPPTAMTSCIKCHSKPGDARDALDLTRPIDCAHALAALEAVATGRMPKGQRPYTVAQLKILRHELEDFNDRFEEPDPAQLPADPQPRRWPQPTQLPADPRPPRPTQLPSPPQPERPTQLPAQPQPPQATQPIAPPQPEVQLPPPPPPPAATPTPAEPVPKAPEDAAKFNNLRRLYFQSLAKNSR